MEKRIQRGRHRVDVENAIIRRREKQYDYDQLWNGTSQYFQHWQKANSKFEQWTSPRYYEDNNKLMKEVQAKRDKEEGLETRRDKLRKLFEEEQRSYDIELMVHKNKMILEKPIRKTCSDIPTELLKQVNTGLKIREEEKRKHEAELKLYHQWRINNPIVKQYESKFRSRDLKFSWLDQQIEKRMQKEKEEEENRRILKERDEQIKKEIQKEECFKKYCQEKREQLRRNLNDQMKELSIKQQMSEQLKQEELLEMQKQQLLVDLEEKQKVEEKRRRERECALSNIQQHKIKLKQKAVFIQENVKQDELLLTKLKELELENILTNEAKKNEIKKGIKDFLGLLRQQKELERARQKHMDFLFDSEAQAAFDRQNEIWKQEENARQHLFNRVIETLKQQIKDNVQKNNEQQKQMLLEQEIMVRKIEEYNDELEKLKEDEELRKKQNKKVIEDDIKVKNARKKLEENIKLKEVNDELERIKKEEERLKQEIMRIQQQKVPHIYSRTNRF